MRKSLPYLLPVLASSLLVIGGWLWLRGYTRHGASVQVPDLEGLTMPEALQRIDSLDLHVMVVDSVYTDDARKGTIVYQDPDPGVSVKPGRMVYLMLNATRPKMIDMPQLVDLSKRQALSVAEIVGLKVSEMRYRPDACVDCVLEQLYKGRKIPAGKGILRGARIVLVLGSGMAGERVPVPDLTGTPYAELDETLNRASLNIGVVVTCDGCNTSEDSALARVYRQSPRAELNNMMAMGGLVDVWLTLDSAVVNPLMRASDTTSVQPPPPDAEP